MNISTTGHTDTFSPVLLEKLNTWASSQSNDAMTTDQTQAWLNKHGIDTQLIHGAVQAKDIWMKDGIVSEEWIAVTCELGWLRDWMNY